MKTLSQSGAALLTFMLVILAGTSFVLLAKLDSVTNQTSRDYASMAALQEAKAVLMGYAVTYPETHDYGPGFLPCPDKNNDGSAGGSCSLAGRTSIGRLPYKTLEISRVTDHFGEVLWYALADNYRNNPKGRLNSDTPGNFTVDAADDVVAVIFAPGPPTTAQSRGTENERLNVANYLEGDNADKGASFVSRPPALADTVEAAPEFNDRLLTITRQELMQAVEQRVLGDVARVVLDYHDQHGAYPWLSPFTDPAHSRFKGQAGQRQGHLPYHHTVGGGKFSTRLAFRWRNLSTSFSVETKGQGGDIVGAPTQDMRRCDKHGILRSPLPVKRCPRGPGCDEPFDVAFRWRNPADGNTCQPARSGQFKTALVKCLQDVAHCDEQGVLPELTALSPPTRINCTWSDRETAACDRFVVTTGPYPYRPEGYTCLDAGTLTRTYDIHLPAFTDNTDGAQIHPPTEDSVRTREVSRDGSIPYKSRAMQIRDKYAGVYAPSDCSGPYSFATSVSTNFKDASGRLALDKLHYDLDVGRGELPAWFVDNHWQKLIYLAYEEQVLPGEADPAQPPCPAVYVDGTLRHRARALAISAGIDLEGDRRRTKLPHYFEANNGNSDACSFDKNKITTKFNDQLRIIGLPVAESHASTK